MAKRSREFYESVGGVSGRVPPFRDQTNRLYESEWHWGRQNSHANQTISEQGAKDLVGQIIHHKSLDNFPFIHDVRETFNPEEHVTFNHNEIPASTTSRGEMNFDPRTPLHVRLVTHEASHLAHWLGNQFRDPDGEGNGFDHEWPFAATHLIVAHHNLTPDAAIDLKNSYRKEGVQWRPRHIGPSNG